MPIWHIHSQEYEILTDNESMEHHLHMIQKIQTYDTRKVQSKAS